MPVSLRFGHWLARFSGHSNIRQKHGMSLEVSLNLDPYGNMGMQPICKDYRVLGSLCYINHSLSQQILLLIRLILSCLGSFPCWFDCSIILPQFYPHFVNRSSNIYISIYFVSCFCFQSFDKP